MYNVNFLKLLFVTLKSQITIWSNDYLCFDQSEQNYCYLHKEL